MKRAAIFLCLIAAPAFADPPVLRTPAPVIYLADNLDEADRLGWCIDTVGRGFSDVLHAHSCKPRGGDVQFRVDAQSGQIRSVAFEGKCAELLAPNARAQTFGLMDCVDGRAAQRFRFEDETGQISPRGDASRCVAVGAESRRAGPYMSRDLLLVDCASAPTARLTWVAKR